MTWKTANTRRKNKRARWKLMAFVYDVEVAGEIIHNESWNYVRVQG